MENYLVYYVDKNYNEYGFAECGLYRIVVVGGDIENDRVINERKAIEKWKETVDCTELEIELENVVYGIPVWATKDPADNDRPYYIMVQHLPKAIKN